jgi:hypothetical protein
MMMMCYYAAPGGLPAGYYWRAEMPLCDIVGTWFKTFDWDCDGLTGTAENYLHPDGTFTSSSGSTGTWALVGDQFHQYFSNGAYYWGTVDSSCTYMSGEMTGPDGVGWGCWWADKIALPSTKASQDDSLDEAGN